MTFDRQLLLRRLLPAALVVAVGMAGSLTNDTWNFAAITAVWEGMLVLSAGLLLERVGLLALCPMSFAGVGVYTVVYLTQHESLPLPLMLAAALLAAIPVGILVGGIALRLRGVNLAVVTFAFAMVTSTFFNTFGFPAQFSFDRKALMRPLVLTSDRDFFLMAYSVLILVGLLLSLHSRTERGRAWLFVRSSERACLATGRSVAAVKIEAFVISAAIAGLAGGIMAYQTLGSVSPSLFDPLQAISLVAVAVMVGAGSLTGAIVGGIFVAVLPIVLGDIGINSTVSSAFFGIGAVMVLSKGTGGMTATWPWIRRSPAPGVSAAPSSGSGTTAQTPVARQVGHREPAGSPASGSVTDACALEIQGLTVRYGRVMALSDVSLKLAPGVVAGLIGPNGAGKSTLIDAVSGFVPSYTGRITVAGQALEHLSPNARARHGVARTFQTCRTMPELTVGAYMSVFARHHVDQNLRDELIDYFELPPANQLIEFVDVGTRRVVELAGALVARPKVLLLDEPAAGLGDLQSISLGNKIRALPMRFDCSVLLIEHDVELVRSAVDELTVLDFGVVVGNGRPGEVLKLQAVADAYLGDTAPANPQSMDLPGAMAAGDPSAQASR